ncbi:hypothetical protein [Agromyces sp. GXS1127]|uniref:hypothetical protein n=1 Tax=Agromyces sp. GXS1127 TaxID=3424181 RepID=UPI003D31ACE5
MTGAPRSRRRTGTVAILIAAALMIAVGGFAWAWSSSRSAESSTSPVELVVVPGTRAWAEAGSAAGDAAPIGGTMAVFQDPDRSRGSLPGWLEPVFPSSRVAQVLGPDGPIAGVGVYAVTTKDLVACLILRIEARRLVWDCTAVRTLAADGLVMRTAIPAGLGSGRDPDGDGMSGDAAVTELLIAEWHADGTFRVALEPR